MVKCSSCGKEIDRIPVWMAGIKVDYVCNNCPNRTMKNIAFMTFEPAVKPAAEAIPLEDESAEDAASEEEL